MASDKTTQDEPIMDGATEATVQEKVDGERDQADADAKRDAALEDNVRSVRAAGENRTGDDSEDE